MFNVNQLRECFPDVDGIKLILINLILNNNIDSNTLEHFESNEKWIKQCFNKPNDLELKLSALNELLDGHGIEPINRESEWVNSYWQDCIANYINMGDTYITTIVYDTINESFLLTSWGDFYENADIIEDNNS